MNIKKYFPLHKKQLSSMVALVPFLVVVGCGSGDNSGDEEILNLNTDFSYNAVVDLGGTLPQSIDVQVYETEATETALLSFSDQSFVEVAVVLDSVAFAQTTEVRESVRFAELGSDVYLTNGLIDLVYPPNYSGDRTITLTAPAEFSMETSRVVVYHPDDNSLEVVPAKLNEDGLIEFEAPSEQRQIFFGLVEELLR